MIEIERKFLLKEPFKNVNPRLNIQYSELISQYYFTNTGGWNIRVREQYVLGTMPSKFCMTMKRYLGGFSNQEIEFPITQDTFTEIVGDNPRLEKIRHWIQPDGDHPQWVIDQFLNPFENLVVAEIELPSEDYPITFPDWIGEEVTEKKEYGNKTLYETLKNITAEVV